MNPGWLARRWPWVEQASTASEDERDERKAQAGGWSSGAQLECTCASVLWPFPPAVFSTVAILNVRPASIAGATTLRVRKRQARA